MKYNKETPKKIPKGNLTMIDEELRKLKHLEYGHVKKVNTKYNREELEKQYQVHTLEDMARWCRVSKQAMSQTFKRLGIPTIKTRPHKPHRLTPYKGGGLDGLDCSKQG
uniref:Uncharacterized protein n=1 Tax=viral metagenome TaxID=1070528 RepID=A0A6M3LLQ7_9ZZZZ